MKIPRRRIYSTGLAMCFAMAVAILTGCGGSDKPVLSINTVSNRADLISDGDALIEIVLPQSASAQGLAVDVDGRDVTPAFKVRADGRILGRVEGLKVGTNIVSASTASAAAARLTITNADRGGPVFSGEHVVPFVCATPVPQGATGALPATNASGLSAVASGSNCSIPTETRLYYRTTTSGCTFDLPDPVLNSPYASTSPPTSVAPPANPCFKAFSAGSTPTDMATVTTDTGVKVPYIVRVERGTMNRGIYDIAVLFDPNKSWDAIVPQPQWNGKLLYLFGVSSGQPRRQVRPSVAWTDDKSLSRGYMVAVNSMTDSAKNSNRVMMTETAMMMKEHVIDTYGPIKFTQGSGCSGGSIGANMISTIGPGLLDGITTSCTFADSETVNIEVNDCVRLVEAYQKPQWLALEASTPLATQNAKKTAINGHLDQTACHGWYNSFGGISQPGNFFQRVVPPTSNDTGAIVQLTTSANNCELPASQVYDPVTNPQGARCDARAWSKSIWGTVAGSTVAGRPTLDNVGVQYGLKALLADSISGEEFVTLNEIVGGSDLDAQPTATRSVADPEALKIAYRSGLVLSGKQLAKVAVIDMRGYDDSVIDLPPAFAGTPASYLQGVVAFGIHQQWRSFSVRDRLDRDAGGHASQAMWRFGRSGFFAPASMATDAFNQMDLWLTKLIADPSASSLEQKVVASKPAATADFCLLSSDTTQSTKIGDSAVCDSDKYLKPHQTPRQVAGGARTEDILKCQLRPIDPAEYGGRLSGAQLARLDAVFPAGVCDWTKPGVGQQASASPLNFQGGPGGQPFGPVPVSTAK
jgi:hypothetical protein